MPGADMPGPILFPLIKEQTMKEIRLYGIWGAWYFLCVVLGAVSDPTGVEKALLVVCALLFFLPGFALLYQAKKTKNPKLISLHKP